MYSWIFDQQNKYFWSATTWRTIHAFLTQNGVVQNGVRGNVNLILFTFY